MGNVPEDVARILGPGEQVQLFIQQKIYHPKISVDSVVLTNERIILRHPHDLRLKRDFTDFSYTDVANAVLDKGVLRSTVRCQLRFGGDPLSLNDLPNSDAEKAYGIIRAQSSAVPAAQSSRLDRTGFSSKSGLLPQGTFVGSQLSLRSSLRESRDLMSSSEISKSNTWLFSRILSSLVDFGITTSPCWRPHRIISWAGVFAYFSASEPILGCFNLSPLASGL